MKGTVEPVIPSLHDQALACLMCDDPDAKLVLTGEVAQAWRAGRLVAGGGGPVHPVPVPGRPLRPVLVPPARVPRRQLGTARGRAALIHALAHIEFNAINLAWDAVYRFRGMPAGFYDDWVRVADEEALHFRLLRERLRQLDHDYGDFDAHNGLWEMACKTAHDVLVRMALVPRVLEARGLDVTPGMMKKLRHCGDQATVDILEIILRDEIGHVAIGTTWYRYCCEQRGLDPEDTFDALIDEYMQGHIREPFHEQARKAAGFSDAEMDRLKRHARGNGEKP